MRKVLVGVGMMLGACEPGSSVGDGDGTLTGDQDVSGELVAVLTAKDGLSGPQDLDFNPWVDDELWVVSRRTDAATIVSAATTDERVAETIVDPFALHFMERVSSIDFGARDTFGTCQDSRNTYNNQAPANDFMGPTLWSSDPEIFGVTNPEAVDYLSDLFGMPTDLGSHLDMLHQSPLCMGIAWQEANIYWVFDGDDGSIVQYDFQEDHGPGYDDHSDGIIARYPSDTVKRVDGLVSHLAWDADSELLYIADTGNARVAVLDPSGAKRGESLQPVEPGTDYHRMTGARPETLVDGADVGLEQPTGLELIGGKLVVADAKDGEIFVFETDGTLVATLETGLTDGTLAGITGTKLSDLWIVDKAGDTVWRFTR